jgi:hypothetical protein
MLTTTRLYELARELDDTPALTVYASSRYEDPRARREWRVALDLELQRLASSLAKATHREREEFTRAVANLEGMRAGSAIPASARGWLAVATAERVVLAEPLPGAVPVEAAWRRGIAIAPFVRVLAERGSAIVTVADGRSARLYRYAEDTLEELEAFSALAISRSAYHMSAPPRRGFHAGTRGGTGRDAAERDRRAARARMVRQVAARLTTLASPEDRLLLGGMTQVAAAIRDVLPPELVRRARVIELDVHASQADIRRAAAATLAEDLRDRERAFVEELVTTWADDGRAVLGVPASLQRLADRAVARLVVTDRLLRAHPEEAERAVRMALDQDATLGYASGPAAERLDARGEGMGASLRFVPGLAPAGGSIASVAAVP